uniref:RNA cytidine acetyltransferase n=1 Tax=Aceria tosichella TaxID=561515 RepID=A0A6G1S9V5_9ACAR
MVRVKMDNRIRTLIENGANTGHRSLFVIVGEKSRDQAVTLYKIWKDMQVKAKPSVLWCYKKELGFSTHRKKRMKEMQKLQNAGLDAGNDTGLNEFILTTNVRWCYYHETHNILGQTYSMVVLQDFEAIQPNILARTIETVEGGGIAVILLNTLHSLKQLFTMSMDVHARYRTESHQDVVSRFNERFILSLIDCKNSCIIDDRFNVLPICSNILHIQPVPKVNTTLVDPKLIKLRESVGNKEPIRSLVALCRTHDQANAVIKFTETLAKKTSRATVSLTAARGRGKSAALGLSIASAIAYGYSNIYVTSPSPENLHTLFEFVVSGLKAVHLAENSDFTVIRSNNPDHGDSVIRINVYKDHNQTIQYIDPIEASQGKLAIQMSNLFVIDEAAAIPLPIVKSFLGSQLVFLSSTVNGYEGTGRSLSLKLLSQLRQNAANAKTPDEIIGSRLVHELTLEEPIRYKAGDPVESWLTGLLCLDATISELPWTAGCPVPGDCQLYYINRDTLFSYHKTSEAFLHQLMALYVASHYKNTPNDLQMISDAPAHHLFCLLPPGKKTGGTLPEVLCFVQVCLEGEISKEAILNSLARGKRAAGDLIPWTISRQFNDSNFPSLSGARIVRIATNPNYQKMGYGTRALQLIYDYYAGMFNVNLSEDQQPDQQLVPDCRDSIDIDEEHLKPRSNLPPLLMALDERKAEKLDYLGVSYGLTPELLKFWKRNKFIPVYIRQTASDITGEHSCIMLRRITPPEVNTDESMAVDGDTEVTEKNNGVTETDWLISFFEEFRTDFIELLVHQFRHFSPQLGLSIIRTIRTRGTDCDRPELSRQELYKFFLTSRKLAILELYSKSLIDYHQIMPLMFRLSKLYFMDWLPASVDLSAVQATILLSMGVQGKSVNDTARELALEPTQLLGLFNRSVKKIETYLRSMEETSIEKEMEKEDGAQVITNANAPALEPMKVSLAYELNKAAKKISKKQKKMKFKD